MQRLVTFGETMLRLSTPEGTRLSRTDTLDVHPGGAESNVAVACSHLGIDATWVSKLPDTDLAARITSELRGEGVDTDVVWSDEGRVGTYYLDVGGDPRGTNVIYDRADAAIRRLTIDEVPLDRIREADAFYTSGITPALSGSLAKTTAAALADAQNADTKTYFDVNYRSKLWDPANARQTLTDLFPDVDVLFVAERDARNVLDIDGEPEAIATELTDHWDFETVVVTRSDTGSLALHDGEVFEQGIYEADTVDAIGTGDAFVGGYVARRLQDGTVPDALAYGAATASLKRTIAGDLAVVSPEEVRAVLDEDASGISR
ncbi:bifunctional 2-dehydro-3-deoxygluconokinase/2-dehydro-3-deoxygalactonokinase [Haloarculaceae archaeon H-GB2-1]|nr:bifunctional 2-dehydro-3-deoxygluconokinase/2-dehydro-3-deoxygalactonokinase [Haloarculaceae archaeon H-GB1-1]MEA5386553.1 bifunctional 2-dehydro-3-deoxygluconokinase/2-dehydro-3-deoxygalactonokinase [Haloarculaceae archaeon H-GB11]MEA5408065.1 bifunctional 2-dehydro-3-deoxygluconokinase/2-dehydro-3-deoxygalactonokinase [Haloarculaceae archaeon H-GB2-1]